MRSNCLEGSNIRCVQFLLMNPSAHLLLLVSSISNLPIKYVRILEELVGSGDSEHLLDQADLKLIARALSQSYVQRAISIAIDGEAEDGTKAHDTSGISITTTVLRLRIGEALRNRMTAVLAAEREESQESFHNEIYFTKFQKFCTTVTLRPVKGDDIETGSHESLSDEGTTLTMEHILNSSVLLDAIAGSGSVRRLRAQLANSAGSKKSEAAAKIDELINIERTVLRRTSPKLSFPFGAKYSTPRMRN